MNSKIPIFLFIVSAFLFACTQQTTKQRAELLFTSKIYERQKDKLTITTELTNNTDSTLNYLTMSCDSLIVYVVNIKNLKIVPRICESNFPVNASLLPHGSLKRKITFIYSDKGINIDTLLKIGFNLFDSEKAMLDEHAQRIIWSKNLLK